MLPNDGGADDFVARNGRPTVLHLTMLTSIVAAAAVFGVSATAAQEAPLHPAIPFCNDRNEQTIGRRLLYITTLDGRLSALDITRGGKLHWSISTGPGPLISSSIHRLEMTNNGEFVRMIPSLSGGIYKFDGESIDPIPITTENLLSSSARFSEDLVISGGKETRTYGVSARTGQLLYECSMHGCMNASDAMNAMPASEPDGEDHRLHVEEHNPLTDDVIVVRRQTQTVRAIESRSGAERWNFSVGQHELNLVKPADCHDRQFSDLDMAILDLDVKVIVPEGVICAFSKSEPSVMLWKHKFDHPIVSGWKIGESDVLESIDMFSSAQWLWDDQDENMFDAPYPATSPSVYLGMYERQLYIQESIRIRREIDDQSNLSNHLTSTETNMPKIPWRPIAASSSSLAVIQSDNVISGTDISSTLPPVQGNELMPYDEENFAVSAQSVLNASQYVNGNGYYFYTRKDLNKTADEETICDTDKKLPALEDQQAEGNTTNHTITDELGFSLDDIDAPVKVVILSLWFWWKEIVVIAFTSAVLLNLFLAPRQRLEREIVVIERHIPVPTAMEATESSTAALLGVPAITPNGSSTKSASNGYVNGYRTLSESTSHSGDNFSSRFQGDFDLVRCLGRGGFGVVFEAKNKLDDCKYAVKRIQLPNKKESRERVMREVKTLANCEHHNIVRYFQAWVETPPPGWQEEEDTKWLAHEMSTSIQIETPDGTTLPSFPSNMAAAAVQPSKGKLPIDKKKQLLSWMSSMASTACSSDHEGDLDDVHEEEDEDSCIVFRTESQSLALREDDDDDDDDDDSDVFVSKSKGKNKKRSQLKSTSDSISIDIHSNSFDLSLNKSGKHIDYSQLSDSFQIEFVRSAGAADEADDEAADAVETEDSTEKAQTNSNSKKSRPSSLKLSKEHNNNSSKNNNNCKALLPALQTPKPPTQNKLYLYIQMQLCRKESLRDWLREHKTESRLAHVGSIFHQIVDAVDYVHLKGLIHRDLKPSNIFFSQDGQIKIGDFGLVTDMSDIPNLVTKCGDASGLPSCARHTQQVGTHLYMSPEQLRGQHYDYKVDIYSLGLIFFELLVYFGTEMERIVTLRDLRDDHYPQQFTADFPAEHVLLKQMLSAQPAVRPPTLELKRELNNILKLPEIMGEPAKGRQLVSAPTATFYEEKKLFY